MRKLLYLALLLAFCPTQGHAQTPTRLQACNTGSISASCALTSVAAHHLLVAFLDCYSICGGAPIGDTFSLTWTVVVPGACTAHLAGPSFDILQIYYADTGTHTGNDTVTTGTGRFIWAAEYSNTQTVLDHGNCSADNTGTSTALTTGNIVTVTSGELLVSFAYGCNTTCTATTNTTFYGADPAAGFSSGDFVLGAASTYAATATASSGTAWIMAGAAFGSSANAPKSFPIVIKYRTTPHLRIPWENRKRKLEIVRI